MIQRVQTLWLILATICSLLSFQFPFATGNKLINNISGYFELDGGSHMGLLLLTGASLVLSTVTIFLFKDRKMQSRLCILGMILSLAVIVIYILQYREFITSTLALWCVLPFVTLISYYMAYRGIRKDISLVKSYDKLR